MKRYFIVNEYFGSRVYDSKNKTEEYYNSEDTEKIRNKLHGNFIEIDHKRTNQLSSPLKISMNITKKCNLRCKQCFTESGICLENELNTKEIYSLFDQMREFGTFFICLGGGEPLTSHDLLDILEYGKNKQLAVSVVSNGLLLTKEYIEQLNKQNLDTFWISLDGLEKNHEALRGIGTYSKALNALKLLRDNFNGKKAIRVTLNKNNFNEYRELIKLAEQHKFDLIRITPLIPYGRAKNENLEITQDEYIDFLKEIRQIKANIEIIYPEKITKIKPWIGTNGFGCHCGKEAMWVDATGNCSPCYFWGEEYNIGNIKNQKFINIWNKSLEKSVIKGNDTCKNCKHYSICRSGCRARSLYLFGNLDDIDPLCPLKKNK